MHTTNINKILILRLSSIGDVLLTFPLIRTLRTHYPDAIIDFVVKKQYVELVSANPYLNHIWTFDSKDGLSGLMLLKSNLRVAGYDVILDIHRSLRSWYLRKFMFGAKVFRYRKYLLKRWLLIIFKINLFKTSVSVVQRYLDTLKSLGINEKKRDAEIFIPPGTQDRVQAVLKSQIQTDITRLIAFCPGAGFPTKRLPVQKFCEIGNNLMAEGNAQIVVLGGAQDAALGEQIRRNVQGAVFNACGWFSLLESAAVLSRCQAIFTNDSSMMHFADALKKPTIAFFGPTTREMGYFPGSEKSIIIEKSLRCRPCTHNGSPRCPEGHFSCMNKITSGDVYAVFKDLVNNDGSNPNLQNRRISEAIHEK